MKKTVRIVSLLLIAAAMVIAGTIVGTADTYSVPIDSYDAFRNAVLGNAYDTDGVYEQNGLDYAYQCWDGANLLWQQLGRTLSTGGTGCAKSTWEVEWARNQNAGSDFTLIYNKYDIKRGDVVVFGPLNDGEWQISSVGHIGFADEDWNYSTTYQKIMDQNFAGRKYFSVHNQNYGSFLGAFRFNRWNTTYASLDVNGYLDESMAGNVANYGTFDVYIDGTLVADDVSDYYNTGLSIGSSYLITDIRAVNGKTYQGVYSGSLSGTLTAAGADIRLAFVSDRTLSIQSILDGEVSDNAGYFDVIIGGETLDASQVTSYSKAWPQGTRYTITNILAQDGKYFEGASQGALSGTIGNADAVVTLSFSTIKPVTGQWCEVDTLPGYIDPEICEIQYQHTYTTTAQSSPGDGWIQSDTGTTTYENDGGVYESDFELATSPTCVHVGSYYYHYCGASMGSRVNFYWTDQYTDYHVAGDVNNFNIIGSWTDDDDPRYCAHKLTWISGEWAGGEATCSAGRSAIWYCRYQYQNRIAVTNYTWTKTSDWEATKDDTAQAVRYRYRLKDTAQPVMEALDVTEVTPMGYTLCCRASDDTSISKVVFSSWTDTESETAAVVQEIVPQAIDGNYQATVTISISSHGNIRDCYYHTKIEIYDAVGNVTEYDGDIGRVYIPNLISSSRKLYLPDNTQVIKDSAFEGDIGFGEVILPEGLERIEGRAFADCSRLTLVRVPGSVTSIAKTAFEGADNVVLLCPAGSAAAVFAHANDIPYLTAEK